MPAIVPYGVKNPSGGNEDVTAVLLVDESGNYVPAGGAGGGGDASAANQVITNTEIGATNETAAAALNTTVGLNGLIRGFWTQIGLKADAAWTSGSGTVISLLKGIGATNETAAADPTATGGIIGVLKGLWTSYNTQSATVISKLDAIKNASEDPSAVSIDGRVNGWGFDIVVVPTVTNGAYSANDIVGGLITVANAARIADEQIILTDVQIALKAAVTSAFTVIILEADPTNTTKTDNAAYSLNAADVFKVRRTIPSTAFTLSDHGTPNTYWASGLNCVMSPAAGARTIYALIIDGTGFTLTSTSDLQIRFCGVGV